MASQTKYWQPDFDPAATFLVAAWPEGHTVRGRQPKRGEVFDKFLISERMLRSHYDARWIVMALPLAVGGEVIGYVTKIDVAKAGDALATLTIEPPPEPAPTRRSRRGIH